MNWNCGQASLSGSPSCTWASLGSTLNQRGFHGSSSASLRFFSARCISSSECLATAASPLRPSSSSALSGLRRESDGSGSTPSHVSIELSRWANSVNWYGSFSGLGLHVHRRSGSASGSGLPSSSHCVQSRWEFHLPSSSNFGVPSGSYTCPLISYRPAENQPHSVNSMVTLAPVTVLISLYSPHVSIHVLPMMTLCALVGGGISVNSSPVPLSLIRVLPTG